MMDPYGSNPAAHTIGHARIVCLPSRLFLSRISRRQTWILGYVLTIFAVSAAEKLVH